MITLITGTPGSGKSYEAVAHHILPALNAGRKVITNLPLDINYYCKVNPSFDRNLFVLLRPTPQNLVPFSSVADFQDEWKDENGVGALYVIDEAHIAFPRGDKNKEMLEFFTMHRHTGADVLLITQQLNQLRREIGGLIELSFVLKKNTVLGSKNSYRKQTRDGTKGSIISTSVHRYDKKIFKFYQSYTLGGQAEAAQKAKPIWFRWPFIAAAIAFLYVAYAAASGGLNPFGNKKKVIEPVAVLEKVPERIIVKAPSDDIVKSDPIVTDIYVTKPEPEPEPEIVVVKAKEPYDLTSVDDITAVRLGNKCKFFLHIGSQKLEQWKLAQKGYDVKVVANVSSDYENFGACSMYVHHIASEAEYVFHMVR